MPSDCSDQRSWLWYIRATDQPLDEFIKELPIAQQNHALSIRTLKRKKHYILSRALICRALSQLFDKPVNDWKIHDTPNTPPLVLNLPNPYSISLSHSNNLICFALSPYAIGIDIERKRLRDFTAAASLFMNAQEYQTLLQEDQDKESYFYRLWCAKEALYKALPHTEQQQHGLHSLSYKSLSEGSSTHYLYESCIDDYQIAIVSAQPIHSGIVTFLEVVL